ncbi:MAG TPA: SDR family NAD(P)-dependent oxidoreductase [Candidatus Binatia bacterium]|nr:SDR family NAD(P)-dependent oxidoreductase [Candidatus Binatia bacterium]
MKTFEGRIAVVTGGGTGMGRELARQLAAAGCHVAMCDVSAEAMAESRALCLADAPSGTRVTTAVADVADEAQLVAFRESVVAEHATDHIHLLFNNAGIGAAGSLIRDSRADWERTFNVCWLGVYYGTRVFLPLLLASPEGHLVNTSSVNGFWASLGPMTAHTAYSAAKFAVKGFTEALINDFRLNAPHVKVSLVMPGHVGTSIVINSSRMLGRDPRTMSDDQLEEARASIARLGFEVGAVEKERIRELLQQRAEAFRDEAPTTAAQAAKIILDGVRAERWRILVGEDAQVLDRMVRETPEEAYEPSFMERFVAAAGWQLTSRR